MKVTKQPYDLLWRSGRIVPSSQATIHVRSVGHASVAAVFEGINAYWSEVHQQLHVFRLREHLERLQGSLHLAHLRMEHSVSDLEAAVVELLRRNHVREDVHIRPFCFVAGNPTEQMVPRHAPCEAVIDSWPFTSGLGRGKTCTAAFPSWRRIGSDTMPPDIKAFANYHNGRLGNLEAQDRGADWPIFLNAQGHVTESSGATVALVKDGVFHTPDLGSGILRGVTRETVIDLLRHEMNVPVVERPLDRSDFYRADEVMFLGTSAEVLPIVRVDAFTIGGGTIQPLTAALGALYQKALRGELPRRMSWLTPVWPADARPGGER